MGATPGGGGPFRANILGGERGSHRWGGEQLSPGPPFGLNLGLTSGSGLGAHAGSIDVLLVVGRNIPFGSEGRVIWVAIRP